MRIAPVLALAALLAGVLYAARPGLPTAQAGVAGAAPVGAAAQQIFLDPLTGQQREPTAEELAQLRSATAAAAKAALRPGATAPEEIHLPDGTVGVRLGQQYYDTIVVCRQPDGHFSSDCPAGGGAR